MCERIGLVIRTLHASERERLLDLLDAWPLPNGRPGRDLFGRFLTHDPTYCDENVWVAEQDGVLAACVQIFPRRIRIAGMEVPVGGIGSVFTREAFRGEGISSMLLEAAARAMRARGMPLSLLFASRHAFYDRLGWVLCPRPRPIWVRGAATAMPDPTRRIDAFDSAGDLDAVISIHAHTSRSLAGTVVRDRAYWEGQLHFAGTPLEDFLVARDAAASIEAYARGCFLDGLYFVTEFGFREGAAEAAADLVLALSLPRDPDPIAAAAGRGSAELRRVTIAPPFEHAAFEAALAARAVERKHFEERAAMWRIIDAPLLARIVGDERRADESDSDWLARVIPPDRLLFWPSDRF
jgi:GNAT superfamily N-acetyltransferase